MNTETSRYYYLWAKPETNALWLDIAYRETDDPNNTFEYLNPEDGQKLFRVGEELVANQWNLVLVDARDGYGDGVDKGVNTIVWHTNENSQWKFDYMGVSVKDPMTFTGKQQDDTTGLYYFNARFYDPMLGRFITEDPIKDGANWYAFCHNNPLKYVDLNGKKPVILLGIWGTQAHEAISLNFYDNFIEAGAINVRFDDKIADGMNGDIINNKRPDIVAYFPHYTEVYEIKQGFSWGLNGKKYTPSKNYQKGVDQLLDYVSLVPNSIRGSHLPFYVRILFPPLGEKAYLNVYSFSAPINNNLDPTGMIYYYADDGLGEGELQYAYAKAGSPCVSPDIDPRAVGCECQVVLAKNCSLVLPIFLVVSLQPC